MCAVAVIVRDHVTKMASNVTWSGGNETVQCNTSRCAAGGGGVDDQRIIRVVTLPIYLATFVFGLIGNTLVIYVIARCALWPIHTARNAAQLRRRIASRRAV